MYSFVYYTMSVFLVCLQSLVGRCTGSRLGTMLFADDHRCTRQDGRPNLAVGPDRYNPCGSKMVRKTHVTKLRSEEHSCSSGKATRRMSKRYAGGQPAPDNKPKRTQPNEGTNGALLCRTLFFVTDIVRMSSKECAVRIGDLPMLEVKMLAGEKHVCQQRPHREQNTFPTGNEKTASCQIDAS